MDGIDGVTPLDVLILINFINSHPSDPSVPAPPAFPPPYYDVTGGAAGDGDDAVTPLDVLAVINHINSAPRGRSEGESLAEPSNAVSSSTGDTPDYRAASPLPWLPEADAGIGKASSTAKAIAADVPVSDFNRTHSPPVAVIGARPRDGWRSQNRLVQRSARPMTHSAEVDVGEVVEDELERSLEAIAGDIVIARSR